MIDVSKHLQVGQTVRVSAAAQCYEIMPVAPDQDGLAVVAVGQDFVVVDDASAGIKMRIPGHILKLVTELSPPLPQAA